MKYDIHVGDYIETVDGWIGYVDYWKTYWSQVCHESAFILKGIAKKDGKELPVDFNFVCSEIPRYFNRIGKYTFGYFIKKEKKKIESISDCNKHIFSNAIKPDNQLVRTVSNDILNKINELVDAVNKLMDNYDGNIKPMR